MICKRSTWVCDTEDCGSEIVVREDTLFPLAIRPLTFPPGWALVEYNGGLVVRCGPCLLARRTLCETEEKKA